MSRRRSFLKTVGATVTTTSLAGCTVFGGGDWENAIGIVLPLSGPLGAAGKAMKRGMDIAMEEVKQDADVTFRVKDNSGTVEGTRSVAKTLIDDKTPIISGVPAGDTAMAMREVAEDRKIPFNTIAAPPDLTQEGTNFAFRTQGDSEQEAKGQTKFFEDAGVNGISVIAADTSFGRTVLDFQKQYAEEAGLQIDHTTILPIDTNNFLPELNKIDTSVTDAVFTPFPGSNAVALINQMKESGVADEAFQLGNSSYGSYLLYNAVGKEKMLGVHNWGVDITNPRASSLVRKMNDRHGHDPDSLSLPGYDQIKLSAKVLREADSMDPETLAETHRNVEYDAAYGGAMKFGSDGHNVGYTATYGKWQETDRGVRNLPAYKTKNPVSP